MSQLISEPIDFYDMTGGMDTISTSTQLGKTKFRDCQNINLFPIGGYQSRNGYTVLNSVSSSTSANNGLFLARYSSGNILVRVCGTKLETMTSGLAGTWVDATGALSLTAGNDKICNFAILNDIVVGANDIDTCFQLNSSLTPAVLAGTPAFTSALFPIEYRGYMFYCNTVESATRQPDRLRFSDINAPNAFTMLSTNNFIDVAKKQGGDVRGAVEYQTNLYIFKRHGIYQIIYQPTRVNSSGVLFPFIEVPNPVIPGVGTQSHKSICKFTTPITNKLQSGTELVFFVDQFGVPRIFDGRNTVQVGYPITNSRDTTIKSLNNVDKTRLPYVWAINYPERNQILCFMSQTNSKNDICWVLDYTTGFAWGRHKFATQFNCGTLVEKNNGTFRPFFGDYSGTVYEYDLGATDNGSNIPWYAVHGDAFLQSPVVNSNWAALEIRGVTGSTTQAVTIDLYKNGEDTISTSTSVALANAGTQWPFIWGQSNWFGGAGCVSQQKELGVDAKTLRLKISNGTTANTATIEGFSFIAARPLGTSQV